MIVGLVVILSAAVGTAAGLLYRSDGPRESPVQQVLGDPLSDQTNWREDLTSPHPRIAYATLDGVYLHPFGGTRAKLTNLVDTRPRWPRQDYLIAMTWSADGRFLAWRQQLMDQPDNESPPTTGLHTLVVVDTASGTSRRWTDDQDPTLGGDGAAFVGDTFVTLYERQLYLHSFSRSATAPIAVDVGPDVKVGGGQADGVVLYHLAADLYTVEFHHVALDGSVRHLSSFTAPEPVSSVVFDPSATRSAVIGRRTGQQCEADTGNPTETVTASDDYRTWTPLAARPTSLGGQSGATYWFDPDGTLVTLSPRDLAACAEQRPTTADLLRARGGQFVTELTIDDVAAQQATSCGSPDRIAVSSDSSYPVVTIIEPHNRYTIDLDEIGAVWRCAPGTP